MHFTDVIMHRAIKKSHRCTWCGETIEIGGQYRRYRSYDGSDVQTVKMHPECYDDCAEVASHDQGDFHFSPYMQERPKPDTTNQPAQMR